MSGAHWAHSLGWRELSGPKLKLKIIFVSSKSFQTITSI